MAVLVQPFAELVTVTVNVPAAVTVGLAVVPPAEIPVPAQLKPVPLVEEAESTTEVVVHVSVPPVALAPGAVLFRLTEVVAVLVHPLAELVTVTVNVPAAVTVGLAVVPPDEMPVPAQLKPVPLVDEAESTTEVTAHVSVPPVAEAPGDEMFCVTLAVAVLGQLPYGGVIVTVYVPVALTLGLAVVPPETIPVPDQLKLTPPVEELAERTTDVVTHVSCPPVAEVPGGIHAL